MGADQYSEVQDMMYDEMDMQPQDMINEQPGETDPNNQKVREDVVPQGQLNPDYQPPQIQMAF